MNKLIKINKKNEIEHTCECSPNEEDNIDIGEDNNKEVVNEYNNSDSQTHDNGDEIKTK